MLCILLSIILPPEKLYSPQFEHVTDKEFSSLRKIHKNIVAFLVFPNDNDLTRKFTAFAKASALFSFDALFIVLTPREAPKTFGAISPTQPCITFIQSGSVVFSTPFPSNEGEMALVIESFVDSRAPPVNTPEELNGLLNSCTSTILAIPPLRQEAERFLYEASMEHGPIAILNVTPQLLQTLGFSGQKLCVYRRTDKVIEEDLILVPFFYEHLTIETITRQNHTVCLYLTETRPRAEEKDILAKMGSQHRDILFGCATPQSMKQLSALFEGQNGDVVLFNYQSYAFYAKGTLKDMNFDLSHPTYPSEAVPPKTDNPQKVVGTTYEDFINQDKDVLMFYTSKPQLEIAQKFSMEILSLGLDLAVGVIDITKNGAPTPFPSFIVNPQVALFPKGAKNETELFFGSLTTYSILSFVKAKGTINFRLSESLFDSNAELYAMKSLIKTMHNYPESLHAELLKYITETGIKMKIGKTTEKIMDTLMKDEEWLKEKQLEEDLAAAENDYQFKPNGEESEEEIETLDVKPLKHHPRRQRRGGVRG